jgi:hypothetical protein
VKSIKQYNLEGCSVGITDGSYLWSTRTALRWPRHDIRTKFHQNWFRHSGNIKVIISTIWEAAVLVLLMGRICDVCRWDNLRWHDTHIPRFMKIGSGIKVILRVFPQQFERLWCWYYWWEGFMMYSIETVSDGMIYNNKYQVSWRSVQK